MRILIPLALAALALAAAAFLGLPKSLGAHPWWSQSVVWIGLPIGLAAALALRFLKAPWLLSLAGLVLLTAGAFALASYGKAQFAASYAEDVLAGRFWYFGWIATAAFSAATLAAVGLRGPDVWR